MNAGLPTTTATVAALAAKELQNLRLAADVQHRLALKARGTPDALLRSRALGTLHDQLLGSACLYSLLEGLGDAAAAEAFMADWRNCGDYIREAERNARMAAVPGYDPATRSFRSPTQQVQA